MDEKNIDGDMVPGNFIKFRVVRKWNDKLKSAQNEKGEFWSCAALIELSPVQEGEVTKAEEKTLAPDAAAVADDLFGKQESAWQSRSAGDGGERHAEARIGIAGGNREEAGNNRH